MKTAMRAASLRVSTRLTGTLRPCGFLPGEVKGGPPGGDELPVDVTAVQPHASKRESAVSANFSWTRRSRDVLAGATTQ